MGEPHGLPLQSTRVATSRSLGTASDTTLATSTATSPSSACRGWERWESVAFDPDTPAFAALRFIFKPGDVPEDNEYLEGLAFQADPLTATDLETYRQRLDHMGAKNNDLPQLLLNDTNPTDLAAGFAAIEATVAPAGQSIRAGCPHVPWRALEVEPYALQVAGSPRAVERARDPYLLAGPGRAERHCRPDWLLERARAGGRLFCNLHAQQQGLPFFFNNK